MKPRSLRLVTETAGEKFQALQVASLSTTRSILSRNYAIGGPPPSRRLTAWPVREGDSHAIFWFTFSGRFCAVEKARLCPVWTVRAAETAALLLHSYGSGPKPCGR